MWKRPLACVAHQVLCPYALLAATAAATYSVVGMFRGTRGLAQAVLLGTTYYPAQIAVGLIAGYIVGRYFVWPLTGWTWVLPAGLLFSALVFASVPHGVSRLDYWFGWSGVVGHAFPPLQPGVTMPFYLSSAYSLAALLGARSKHCSGAHDNAGPNA